MWKEGFETRRTYCNQKDRCKQRIGYLTSLCKEVVDQEFGVMAKIHHELRFKKDGKLYTP